MLRWVIGFLIVAVLAAVLGFGLLATAAAAIAKIIFYIFLMLFVISDCVPPAWYASMKRCRSEGVTRLRPAPSEVVRRRTASCPA